jgi:pimeloyl-ACP methyl ester carboxylesterase
MAEDVIALLDFIGWTERRSLHVVGTSLGGMIAQGEWRTYFLLVLTSLYHTPRAGVSYSRTIYLAGPGGNDGWRIPIV